MDPFRKGERSDVERLRPGAKITDIRCESLLRWIRQPRVSWDLA